MNIIIEFRIFKLVFVPNFSLNWQFWFFWPDLPKKGFFGLKQKKWKPHIFYIILHIQISLVRNSSSNWQFWFFGQNLSKMVVPVKNWKTEHHHWIPHIQISLGTKFQLRLTLMTFLTRFAQKGFFWSKTEKVNITYFLHNSTYSDRSSVKFQLKLTILSFWTKFAQKSISSQKLKCEHYHGFPYIQISLSTKFQLKLTFLSFLIRFAQKGFQV